MYLSFIQVLGWTEARYYRLGSVQFHSDFSRRQKVFRMYFVSNDTIHNAPDDLDAIIVNNAKGRHVVTVG